MENISPEVVQITLACVKSLAAGFLGYASLITGLEIGGMIAGYPGKGREIHEQLIKALFHRGNNRRKK